MKVLGRAIAGAFIGAIINASSLLIFGLLDDYFFGNNIRTFLPVTGAILGFIIGFLTGAITAIIQPNTKKAVFVTSIITIIYDSIVLILKFQYLSILINRNNYLMIASEIIYLGGFSMFFIFSVWLVSKLFAAKKEKTIKLR